MIVTFTVVLSTVINSDDVVGTGEDVGVDVGVDVGDWDGDEDGVGVASVGVGVAEVGLGDGVGDGFAEGDIEGFAEGVLLEVGAGETVEVSEGATWTGTLFRIATNTDPPIKPRIKIITIGANPNS